MCWRSIVLGLMALGDWRILLGVGWALTVTHGGRLLLEGSLREGLAKGRVPLLRMGVITIGSNALEMSGFSALCMPVLLGRGGLPPWRALPFLFAVYGVIGFLVAVVLWVVSWEPFVGRRFVSVPGQVQFIQGITMVEATVMLAAGRGAEAEALLEATPRWWCFGLYVGLGLLVATMVMGATLIAWRRRHRLEAVFADMTGQLPFHVRGWGLYAGTIGGLLETIMFGKYVAISLGWIGF